VVGCKSRTELLLSCRAVFGVSWVVVVVVEKVTVTVEKETTERRNDGMRRVGEATVVVRQVWSWCAVAGHRRKVRRGRRCQRGKGDGERTRPTSSITAGTSERNEEEMAVAEQRTESTARRQKGCSKEGFKGFKGGGETFQVPSNHQNGTTSHGHEHRFGPNETQRSDSPSSASGSSMSVRVKCLQMDGRQTNMRCVPSIPFLSTTRYSTWCRVWPSCRGDKGPSLSGPRNGIEKRQESDERGWPRGRWEQNRTAEDQLARLKE
jgi:hypothetical protein